MHKENIFDLFNEQNKPKAAETVLENIVTPAEVKPEIVTPEPETEKQPTSEVQETVQENITPQGEEGGENGV